MKVATVQFKVNGLIISLLRGNMILLGLLTMAFSSSLSTATPTAATFVVNTSSPRVPFLSPWTKAIGSGHVSSLLVHSSAWHKLWYTQR